MDNNRKSLFDFDEHEEQLKKGLSSKLSKRITSKIAAKPSRDSKDLTNNSKEEVEKINPKDFSSMRDTSKRNMAEPSRVNNFVINNQKNMQVNDLYLWHKI